MNDQPPRALTQWRTLALRLAADYHLNALIVLSQIWTESEGIPWATRYEPNWRYFWKGAPLWDKTKSRDTNRRAAFTLLGPTEFHLQSMSMGLMQVMGAVARERGMKNSLPQLYEPETGIQYGCLHLSILLKSAGGDIGKALERYNGSILYAEKVLHRSALL